MPGIQYWHEVNDAKDDDCEEDQPGRIETRHKNLPVFDRGRTQHWDFDSGRWYSELDFND